MGRSRGKVSLKEIVGLDARPHETSEQLLQGVGIVVDAAQKDGLVQDRYSRAQEASNPGAKLVGELAGMVGMDHRPHRSRLTEHPGQGLGDP